MKPNSLIVFTILMLTFTPETKSGWITSIVKTFDPCSYMECCNDDYISYNQENLLSSMKVQVFGQHIATERVGVILSGFFERSQYSRKPLVMSLHGPTGVGKNFISSIIVKSIYRKGFHSKYVHRFSGRLHFPRLDHVYKYKENLQTWIPGNVSACPRSIFIFDEVEKTPEGILDSIIPMFTTQDIGSRIDYTQSIFIFLSNDGSSEITNKFFELWSSGVLRQDMTYFHFETLLKNAAYNTEGGFRRSDLLLAHDVNWLIPLLPLERRHVYSCIVSELERQGLHGAYKKHHIESIIDDLIFYKDLLSASGCKIIHERVNYLITMLHSEL